MALSGYKVSLNCRDGFVAQQSQIPLKSKTVWSATKVGHGQNLALFSAHHSLHLASQDGSNFSEDHTRHNKDSCACLYVSSLFFPLFFTFNGAYMTGKLDLLPSYLLEMFFSKPKSKAGSDPALGKVQQTKKLNEKGQGNMISYPLLNIWFDFKTS